MENLPSLVRKKSGGAADFASAGERFVTDIASTLLESYRFSIAEVDSYISLYTARIKVEEDYIKALRATLEKQRELDYRIDHTASASLGLRSSETPELRKVWRELRDNDKREIETRMHYVETLRTNVIATLTHFRDSQERIRRRVKQDVKTSSAEYEEMRTMTLPKARRAYEKRCEEVDQLRQQQQAIEDQRSLLSSSNASAPQEGSLAQPSSEPIIDATAVTRGASYSSSTSTSSTPPQLPGTDSDVDASKVAAATPAATTASNPSASPGRSGHAATASKSNFLDVLRSKDGWEAARKGAKKEVGALWSKMREVGDKNHDGPSSPPSDGNTEGAVGLGRGSGSMRQAQNTAAKTVKAKRDAEDADKVYRKSVFDLETLRIRRERVLIAAAASCVDCRKELAKAAHDAWLQAERTAMVLAGSSKSLHEHGETFVDEALPKLNEEVDAFEARLPNAPEATYAPIRYVNFWHGEQDLIFGVSLSDYYRAPSIALSGQPPRVSPPRIVRKCIEYTEARALDQQGIYRISARQAAIQDLVHLVEKDERNFKFDPAKHEPAAVAGLLKLYLRQLPEPVLHMSFEDRLRHTHEREEHIRTGFAQLKGRIRRLPQINQVTLRAIIKHLNKVAAHAESNKMTAANLAVVFGPVLLSEASHETTSIAAAMEEDLTMTDMIQYADTICDLTTAGAPVLPPVAATPSFTKATGSTLAAHAAEDQQAEQAQAQLQAQTGAEGLKRQNAVGPGTAAASKDSEVTAASFITSPEQPSPQSTEAVDPPELPPRDPIPVPTKTAEQRHALARTASLNRTPSTASRPSLSRTTSSNRALPSVPPVPPIQTAQEPVSKPSQELPEPVLSDASLKADARSNAGPLSAGAADLYVSASSVLEASAVSAGGPGHAASSSADEYVQQQPQQQPELATPAEPLSAATDDTNVIQSAVADEGHEPPVAAAVPPAATTAPSTALAQDGAPPA